MADKRKKDDMYRDNPAHRKDQDIDKEKEDFNPDEFEEDVDTEEDLDR
jgi:hypothetical protein